ncbi:MAG TPA: Holliday junction resolvase RecU [Bacillales bacterium]|nr:Holliday junction resolvase RecU [Bacillales bacterium]
MKFNYPNGKTVRKQTATYGNRGMTLEEDINLSNEYYVTCGKAVIHKKPTPVQIVDVDYPKRSAAVIKEAYFRKPSTTDYNGVYRGRYIDFEAKETQQKTSFPLKNFHEHQMVHMKRVINHGGHCFVLLRFAASGEVYFLDASRLLQFWHEQKEGGRKSVKKSEIAASGELVPCGFRPRIDYLSIVDKMYFDS